jgi:hypothetical protein
MHSNNSDEEKEEVALNLNTKPTVIQKSKDFISNMFHHSSIPPASIMSEESDTKNSPTTYSEGESKPKWEEAKKPQPSRFRPNLYSTSETGGGDHLKELVSDISRFIEENNQVLQSTSKVKKERFNSNSYDEKENRKNRKSVAEIENDKKQMQSIMDKQKSGLLRMPKWRFALIGKKHPPKNTLIGGKSLFRAIVKSIMLIIIRPSMKIMLRDLSLKDKEMNDFERNLNIISDTFGDWLGKIIHLPLSSTVQVYSLANQLIMKILILFLKLG